MPTLRGRIWDRGAGCSLSRRASRRLAPTRTSLAYQAGAWLAAPCSPSPAAAGEGAGGRGYFNASLSSTDGFTQLRGFLPVRIAAISWPTRRRLSTYASSE